MMKKYPLYIKCTMVLLGLVLLVFCLSMLRDIFVPIAFALMLAFLLAPAVVRLEAPAELRRCGVMLYQNAVPSSRI